jgi:hypothetical protein
MNAAFITKEDDERHIHHYPRRAGRAGRAG